MRLLIVSTDRLATSWNWLEPARSGATTICQPIRATFDSTVGEETSRNGQFWSLRRTVILWFWNEWNLISMLHRSHSTGAAERLFPCPFIISASSCRWGHKHLAWPGHVESAESDIFIIIISFSCHAAVRVSMSEGGHFGIFAVTFLQVRQYIYSGLNRNDEGRRGRWGWKDDSCGNDQRNIGDPSQSYFAVSRVSVGTFFFLYVLLRDKYSCFGCVILEKWIDLYLWRMKSLTRHYTILTHYYYWHLGRIKQWNGALCVYNYHPLHETSLPSVYHWGKKVEVTSENLYFLIN